MSVTVLSVEAAQFLTAFVRPASGSRAHCFLKDAAAAYGFSRHDHRRTWEWSGGPMLVQPQGAQGTCAALETSHRKRAINRQSMHVPK